MLKENLINVQAHIDDACKRAGRNPADVTLIAVSKTKPLSDVEEILDCGVLEFGENKVQELCDKYEHIKSPVHWHMIGHLQTNKVKYIVDKVALIHSVDSLKLANVIDKESQKKGVVTDILIEVNVAEEDSKFGVSTAETVALVRAVSELSHVRVKGLMTIAPFVANPEDNRKVFRTLKQLFVDIDALHINNVSMEVLSMGMTNDYMVAIEEGATMVRVGTGIFGERNYAVQ
jgi:hypothetical protein